MAKHAHMEQNAQINKVEKKQKNKNRNVQLISQSLLAYTNICFCNVEANKFFLHYSFDELLMVMYCNHCGLCNNILHTHISTDLYFV